MAHLATSRRGPRLPLFRFLLVAALALPTAQSARATCDVIPGVIQSFRGALGTVNRPFAIPGDVGQQLEITLSPSGCDGDSPGLVDLPGGALPEDDYFVTVLFQPPNGVPNAVVLTTAANHLLCDSRVAEGASSLLGGSGFCRDVQPGTLELTVVNETQLRFRFPDTDEYLEPNDDDLTFAGPATIAVTPISDQLPFALATARCATLGGLVACIDELYRVDAGTCDDSPANVDPIFGRFTALPPPNDYRALCITPGTECTGTATELRFTIDEAGNALVPVDWRGVLLRPGGIPVPRLLRGTTTFEAFSGGPPDPVRIPGRSFLRSYAPSGRRLPPLFEPLADPSSPITLFGSVDAAIGVMRIARRMPLDSGVYRACSSGTNDGLPCIEAGDCPAGTCGQTTCYQSDGTPTSTPCTRDADCAGGSVCGPSLFDFSDRLDEGVGPILIPSSAFSLDAENPVPLEGLLETPSMFAFVELEAIANQGGAGPTEQDLNGDGDTTDAVLVLRDRTTGTITPIGAASGGRAVTRVHESWFSAPAVAVEGDVAAFLESEPLQCNFVAANCDENGDNDVFDSILRVYRRADGCGPQGAPCAEELTTGPGLAVDAAPEVEARSVVVSNGLVFFRVAEAQNAPQTTVRLTAGNQESSSGQISDDGRFVGFKSHANDLLPSFDACGNEQADTNNVGDGFVLDRDTNADGILDEPGFTRVSRSTVYTPAGQAIAESNGGGVSPDGRYARFESRENLDPRTATNDDTSVNPLDDYDGYLRDRDLDGDGIFSDCEPGKVETRAIAISSTGEEADRSTFPGDMTPDGRFVILLGSGTNLDGIVPDTNGEEDVFVHDRDFDGDGIFDDEGDDDDSDGNLYDPGEVRTLRVSVDSSCQQASGHSGNGKISDDGRFVAFGSFAPNLVPGDTNNASDVFVRDRDADGDGVFDECNASTTTVLTFGGEQGNSNTSQAPDLTADGRLVAFWSDSSNLISGDTNDARDGFVYDRSTGRTTRVSVNSAGEQQDDADTVGTTIAISRNGRYVVFSSAGTNLVPGDTNGFVDAFLHDIVTGHTERVSVAADGSQSDGDTYGGAPSSDGLYVIMDSHATNLGGNDPNGSEYDVFVYGPDPSDQASDLTGDGDLDDAVLYVLDTGAPVPAPVALGAASSASVSNGSVAFLLPEAATGVDRNGDQDLADAFVHLSVDGAPAQDLSQEAIQVGLSPELVAVLVPAVGGERFLRVYDRAQALWSANLGPAADAIQVRGAVVALREAATGALYVYDHASATVTPVGATAEDFVLGDRILALRTSEEKAVADLNGDSDTSDDVLQVYDLVSGQLLSTHQAVTPCRFEACDARLPYRVIGDNVTFLTLEADQGSQDLDGNGDATGLVIQTFNARQAAEAAGGGGSFALAGFSPSSGPSTTSVGAVLGSVSAGICTTTGQACATDADCGGGSGSCYVPPGGCIENVGTYCTINVGTGASDCPHPQYCVPTPGTPLVGTCHRRHGPCDSTCMAPLVCKDDPEDLVRIAAPLAPQPDGRQLFMGRAIETTGGAACVTDDDCAEGELCSEDGSCELVRPVVVGSPDSDADGIADDLDNCPRHDNAGQADLDGDGAGDACDLQSCGDGIQTYAEECDDGNRVAGDGCDAGCLLEGATPACSNGLDDDGDGLVDLQDGGCQTGSDASEREAGRPCDDGIDNDGDGLVDAPADPGCKDPDWGLENPKCQDGLDNDGRLGTDFDGGVSVLGAGHGDPDGADPQCAPAAGVRPYRNREAPGGPCGLGTELAFGLLAFARLHRRRRCVAEGAVD